MNNVVKVENLSFSLSGQEILRNLTFSIERGSFVGLVGPNGGGKTSLIKILLGTEVRFSGTVSLFGDEKSFHRSRKKIGYVPQHSVQSRDIPATAEEVVMSGLVVKKGLFRFFKKRDWEMLQTALELLGIPHLRKRSLFNLSGGERQKVFIARALISDPEFLVLDEPLVGVDALSEKKFYGLLKMLKNSGKTILLVSHDLDGIAKEIDSLLCLNKTLFVHETPESFSHVEMMERMYGENISFIRHTHTHE